MTDKSVVYDMDYTGVFFINPYSKKTNVCVYIFKLDGRV